MKICIKNFGPIAEFHYDLSKDIVITFGDNNIGKSYAMQVVYLFLKNFSEYLEFKTIKYYYNQRFYIDSYRKELKKMVLNFEKEGQNTENITGVLNDILLKDLSDQFLTQFINSCKNTFGNFSEIQNGSPTIKVQIIGYNLEISLGNTPSIAGRLYRYPTFLKRSSSSFHKSRNANGRLDIYYFDDASTTFDKVLEVLNEERTKLALEFSQNIGPVYFLPASRSGIYSGMSAFSSIIAELSKSKAMLSQKIELPGISEPISDYFLQLSNVKENRSEAYSTVYAEIETQILRGKVSFNRNRNTLVYVPQNMEHEFEMTEVSSMVSEISPIVAFLKYIVRRPRPGKPNSPKPILFIEEPEAHLHPKNQIKLVELFAKMHTLGVKIVMSSHSNYIFNKMNNLLLGASITPDIYSAILLKTGTSGSVSTFMPIDELGVDDMNFLDVAESLYNERETLIEEWNELE